MQLSVIIVNYNVRAFLENSLTSVVKSMNGINGEIIVVDNCSDDGSIEMVKEKFPNVKLIMNERNVGFAAANNQAIKKASGKYLLLLNPDTILQEDTFRVMIDFLDKNDDVGLAGCKILNPDGTLQLACRRSFPTPWVAFTKVVGLSNLFPKSPIFAKYNLAYLDPDKTYEVDAVSGSFMFVRKKVIDEVGLLDEQFFMYGEDLDLCYRIKKAGWKIYYVHSTQVIHYKGESVRRSNLDDVKLFYEAMRVFVSKHFSKGIVTDTFLRLGIGFREWIASLHKITKLLRAPMLDFLLINFSFLLGEFIWFGKIFHYPSYAYPVVIIVPAMIVIASLYSFGVYTKHKLSISSTINSIILSFIILSSLTFFFKQYGFSRMVVIISGCLNLIFLSGWRMVAKLLIRSPEHRRRSIFGRRTLIVGVGQAGQELLQKIRKRIDDGYDVIGFVDLNRKRIGEKINGIEILGSIDNIGKIIKETKASEVIFSTDILSFSDILSVISRSENRNVNFRLVPNSIEVIIGKTHIDELDNIPLIDIDYNVNRTLNRFNKRLFDIFCSGILLITIYPILKFKLQTGKKINNFVKMFIELPKVFKGEMSMVGTFNITPLTSRNDNIDFLGKHGITGLVQINYRDDLTNDEIGKYNLYYAKNQSLILDIEILLKTFFMIIRKKGAYGKSNTRI